MGSANWSREDAPFSGYCLPILLHLLQCSILILKCSPCTAVMRTVVPHMTLTFLPQFLLTCFGHVVLKICVSQPVRVAFLALESSFVLSGRVVSETSCG